MRKSVVLLVVLALLGATFASADAGAAGVRARAMKQRLKPFPSCQRLIGYAHRYTRRELRGGGGIFAPAPQPIDNGTRSPGPNGSAGGDAVAPEGAAPTAGDSSGTNTQEAGVDEPDIVKTDGTHIFAVSGNRLNVIDARADTPKLLDSLELESYGGDLLLQGTRLLVISYAPSPLILPPQTGGPQPARGAQVATEPGIAYPYRAATLITEVDVSDPTALKVVRTETIDGSYVSARQNGATARIVLNTSPAALDTGEESLRPVARGWVPRARLENKLTGRKRTRRITSCTHVRRPRVFSGLDVLTVLTVDMRKGLPAVDTDALMTDGQTVYASNDSLYIATQRFVPEPAAADLQPPPLTTAIHRFDISDPGRTVYKSSGEAPGYVIGQFALSEFKGVLRVASTDSPVWWPGAAVPETQSYVSTLKEVGDVLLPLGRVGGLGKGERILGVRFLDDAGYVVTFRQTDPLYTIDLSEPDDPRVAGELKLLGFSAYLHPVGDGLLLGVGQDATAQGRQLGTQLSLFDVSNLAQPQRLSQARVGGSSSSEVEYDHHAFLYWAPTKLAVIPVYLYDGSNPFTGAIGYRIGRTSIDELARISHDGQQYAPGIRRSVVIGDRLFTISDLGAKSSNLSTLADEAFVEFPQPPQQTYPPGGSGGGVAEPGQSSPSG
jgi:hypothetical protein